MALPVYVGCSMNFSGLTVEEEMEGLTKVVEIVVNKWKERVERPLSWYPQPMNNDEHR